MERDIHHVLQIISTKLLWFNPLMSTLQHQCNENISDTTEFCHYSRGIVNLINSIYVISFQITIIVEKQQDKPWKGRDFFLGFAFCYYPCFCWWHETVSATHSDTGLPGRHIRRRYQDMCVTGGEPDKYQRLLRCVRKSSRRTTSY